MASNISIRMIAAGLAMLAMTPGACTSPPPAKIEPATPSAAVADLLSYLRSHRSTGFIVVEDGKVRISETWPAPDGDRVFSNFVYGNASDGSLLEDVASQQKSFVAILAAIAIDKGLLDIDKPVSAYLGQGWSKASPDQEARIRVIDVLTMSSGLDEKFAFAAPAGTVFFYNTPVYAVTKAIVASAAKQPFDIITQEWLTTPAGMGATAWRKRPAALNSVGNDTGLVTTPGDVAKFGLMILHDGVAENGTRIVSQAQLKALFTRSSTNPAYGRLWWLNGGSYSMSAVAGRKEGPLIAAAPADLVGALGAFDRRLYVVPSRKLVVVRTGAATNDPAFDQNLWLRLMKVLN